ncbi:hypothetical protein GFM13_19340 [Rhizobium leguminosarum bv. viciae]|nr:hypothetical protein [Rhizobium leguminosarum bv. viciae]
MAGALSAMSYRPFLICAALKIAYDLQLLLQFRHLMKFEIVRRPLPDVGSRVRRPHLVQGSPDIAIGSIRLERDGHTA